MDTKKSKLCKSCQCFNDADANYCKFCGCALKSFTPKAISEHFTDYPHGIMVTTPATLISPGKACILCSGCKQIFTPEDFCKHKCTK